MASSSVVHSAPASISPSYKYDIFLSFRGEDTRKNFIDLLYSALVNQAIHTFKDDDTLRFSESISTSQLKAIRESRIALVILSKNYVASSWCLDELAHIMKYKEEGGLMVMPIFYNVDPSDVRKPKGDFGKAFARHEVKNISKAQLWRKSLVDVSNLSGWDIKNFANGYESEAIRDIVDTMGKLLLPLNADFDEFVGMETRLEDLILRLEIGSEDVCMVGICGLGGSGKTTLATVALMQIRDNFQGYCILQNVREKSSKFGLKKLQEYMLSTFSKKEVKLPNVVKGKDMMKTLLCNRKVLIVLDDVSDIDQLDALVGSHNWFGGGSRIIITTRDEDLLRAHKVNKIYHVRLLSSDEGTKLFDRYAFNERNPIEGYKTLSSRVISYAAGLPMALKALGSFLYDKDKEEWMSTLNRLEDIPRVDIISTLKFSYDGLEIVNKDLFLDITCFWRGELISDAVEVFEACGYHHKIGIKVLKQKGLVIIGEDGRFYMHSFVQEMAHEIVRRGSRRNSRVWEHESIRDLCSRDATIRKDNDAIQAIIFDYESYDRDFSSRFSNVVSNMANLRFLSVKSSENANGPTFLSNELRYLKWRGYPASSFPDGFQPTWLAVLKLHNSMQRKLWNGDKYLPCLKRLSLSYMFKLTSTPDFYGLPGLEELRLVHCVLLKEIPESLGLLYNLKHLTIRRCPVKKKIVRMDNLKTLEIVDCNIKEGKMLSSIGELSKLEELDLRGNHFSRLDFSLSKLTCLRLLNLSKCKQLLELPDLPSSIAILKAEYCLSLKSYGHLCHKRYKFLREVSLRRSGIIKDGIRLLRSMSEGEAVENGSMILNLPGVEVAEGFGHLFSGTRYRLKLPENWWYDFTGFLICAAVPSFFDEGPLGDNVQIVMTHVTSDTGSEGEDAVVWKRSTGDGNMETWVRYVSFDSLTRTAWWDTAYEAVEFSILSNTSFVAVGARLVRMERSEASSITDKYTPKVKVLDDVAAALTITLPPVAGYDFDGSNHQFAASRWI